MREIETSIGHPIGSPSNTRMAGLSAAALLSAGHTKERFGPSVEAPEWDEIATVTAGAEVDVWIGEVDQGLIDPLL